MNDPNEQYNNLLNISGTSFQSHIIIQQMYSNKKTSVHSDGIMDIKLKVDL